MKVTFEVWNNGKLDSTHDSNESALNRTRELNILPTNTARYVKITETQGVEALNRIFG